MHLTSDEVRNAFEASPDLTIPELYKIFGAKTITEKGVVRSRISTMVENRHLIRSGEHRAFTYALAPIRPRKAHFPAASHRTYALAPVRSTAGETQGARVLRVLEDGQALTPLQIGERIGLSANGADLQNLRTLVSRMTRQGEIQIVRPHVGKEPATYARKDLPAGSVAQVSPLTPPASLRPAAPGVVSPPTSPSNFLQKELGRLQGELQTLENHRRPLLLEIQAVRAAIEAYNIQMRSPA